MTFDPYELAVRLRTLLDVTDCQSVLLTLQRRSTKETG